MPNSSNRQQIIYLEAAQTLAVIVALVGGLVWHRAAVLDNHRAILASEARIERLAAENARLIRDLTAMVERQAEGESHP